MTRSDLSSGAQAVQSCHAFREFGAKHPDLEDRWYRGSNVLALLSVADESRLRCLLQQAAVAGIRYAEFYEPDQDGALTAVALEPGPRSRRLCRSLPLTLGEGAAGRPRGP